MCGCIQVRNTPSMAKLLKDLGLPGLPQESLELESFDLRPSMQVTTISQQNKQPAQSTMTWGIKPSWSKKLIINAQSETAAHKKTFAQAFATQRCLIPCTGWYEWRDEGGAKKQKYLFDHPEGESFLMAGLWFKHDGLNQLVTLTTQADGACAKIHGRMPLIIEEQDITTWLTNPIPRHLSTRGTKINIESVESGHTNSLF